MKENKKLYQIAKNAEYQGNYQDVGGGEDDGINYTSVEPPEAELFKSANAGKGLFWNPDKKIWELKESEFRKLEIQHLELINHQELANINSEKIKMIKEEIENLKFLIELEGADSDSEAQAKLVSKTKKLRNLILGD